MIDFNVGPCIAVVLPLLQIERVEFVGLCGRAGHQPIKNRWIAFDSGAIKVCLIGRTIARSGGVGGIEN